MSAPFGTLRWVEDMLDVTFQRSDTTAGMLIHTYRRHDSNIRFVYDKIDKQIMLDSDLCTLSRVQLDEAVFENGKIHKDVQAEIFLRLVEKVEGDHKFTTKARDDWEPWLAVFDARPLLIEAYKDNALAPVTAFSMYQARQLKA